jgi:hypothetical protein
MLLPARSRFRGRGNGMSDGKTNEGSRLERAAAKRQRFLDHLAEHCNVEAACQAAGLAVTAAYKTRRRDAAFAEEWRAALLTGYDRLEEQLLRHAGAGGPDGGGSALPENFDPEAARHLLLMHNARLKAGPRRPRSGQIKRATPEEVNAALLKQLKALRESRRRAAARGETA